MHKIIGLTVGLITATALLSNISVSAKVPTLWVRILTVPNAKDGSSGVYFVNEPSVISGKPLRYFWTSLQFDKPVPMKRGKQSVLAYKAISFRSVNCNRKDDYRVYNRAWFDKNDKLITKDKATNSRGEVIKLNLLGDKAAVNYVCTRKIS
ncbi:hypothetical protein Cri9333_1526 [Crinalium epipsammum PCC 9333]|uniref:Uncharacterized protein n=1 Tax=Crinalium epipsammum PCC 9333 TaxID=1173022 RepID=K9VWD8_9CYAN|nr:hypothetical protein [Crinalium epipsammum]AFZ12418.1 hypothetical protein Cri9333_1526 [Crinalium epipsammum PCC 9333]